MGISEESPGYYGIYREDYLSYELFKNDEDYQKELEALNKEYPFLTAMDDNYEDIPEDAAARYDIFKKSIVQYHFLNLVNEFYKSTGIGTNTAIIEQMYKECFSLMMDEKYQLTHKGYSKTYLKALKFGNQFVCDGNVNLINTLPEEEIKGYFYILHRDNYFQSTPVPDNAFDINRPGPYSIIAKVYAKYFRYKDFIADVYGKVIKNENQVIYNDESSYNEAQSQAKKKVKQTISSLINERYRKQYEAIFKTLAEPRPLTVVAEKKENMHKKYELLHGDSKLRLFQTQMVCKIDGDKIILDDTFPKLDMFLMHLFSYLIILGWMRLESTKTKKDNISATVDIINNSLFCKSDENKSIHLNTPYFTKIYNEMRREQISDDNSYMKFIKLAIC